jgi:hypothetical protein
VLAVGFFGVAGDQSKPAHSGQSAHAIANAVLFGTVTAGVCGMTKTDRRHPDLYQMSACRSSMGRCWFGVVAELVRRDADATQRAVQRRRAILVDALAASGNDRGGGAVHYLSLVWALIIGFAVWGDVLIGL